MTIYDLRCDRCAAPLSGPVGSDASGLNLAVRFRYHPGRADLGDDAGLLCQPCWSDVVASFGAPRPRECARCAADLRNAPTLYVNQAGELRGWRLCSDHALEFLNSLRTVAPKLDPSTFALPFERSADGSARPNE